MRMKPPSPKEILGLLYAQRFTCAYTGEPLTPDDVSADHKQPVSRGGDHVIGNIAIVRRAVNAAKGQMTLAEFVEMCRKVTLTMVGPAAEPAADAAPPPPETLGGTSDPVEILARLGYVEAAEAVRAMRSKIERTEMYARKRGKVMTSEEYEADRRGVLDQLQREIQLLQSKRTRLRSNTVYVATPPPPER